MAKEDEISTLFRRARLKASLSQRELARMLGVTQPYISQIESGERIPSLRLLQKAGKAGIDVAQLFKN